MPGIQKFDGGLYSMGPPDTSPPGTMRRNRGIARVSADSARSRFGGTEVIALPGAHSMVRFNGRRYFVWHGELYNQEGVVLYSPTPVLLLTTFVIAPVGPSRVDYLFGTDGRSMFKMAPDETITDWGIAPFEDDPLTFALAVATGATKVIDACESNAGYTTYPGSIAIAQVGSLTTHEQTEGTFCVELTADDADGEVYFAYKDLSADLSTFSGGIDSPEQDYISLWVWISEPQSVEYVFIEFALTAGYSVTSHEAADTLIHIARFTGSKARKATEVGIALETSEDDQRLITRGNTDNLIPFDPVASETWKKFLDLETVFPGFDKLRAAIINASPTNMPPNAKTWTELRIPKDTFFRIGPSAASWESIFAMRLGFKTNKGTTIIPSVRFDDIKLKGGYGLRGNYHGYITAKNFTTDNESQPTATFREVHDIDRTPIGWTLPGTHPDPQVDTVVLYRTLGDGGLFFKATEVPVAAEFVLDDIADAPGMDDAASEYLQPDELSFTNIKPEGTYADAVLYQGAMFWTRDRDITTDDPADVVIDTPAVAGRGSRVYYTRPGFVEGVQGFISLGNDDEACQKLVVWNRALYCFTKRAVYQIIGTTQPYTANQIRDIPGTLWYRSVQPTSFGIIYEAEDGFRVFTGAQATLAPSMPLAGLFQGRALENLTAWHGTTASAAGLDYYYVSDGNSVGSKLLCLDSQGQWRDIGAEAANDADGAAGLYFEPQTGLFLAGMAHGVQILEEEGVFLDECLDSPSNPTSIDIDWEPPHMRIADPHQTAILRRIHIDINLNGQTLTPTLIIDGTETTLAPITNTSRAMVELARNTPCRLLGVRLTGSVAATIELFGIVPDVWTGDSSR